MQTASILAIDDNAASLKLMAVLLRSEGFDVRTAVSAADALAQLEQWRPDLILTDLQLPDVHGLDLLRRLKAEPRWHAIPVVAVTAYAMSGERDRALAAGCVAFVSKPIDTRALAPLLKALLDPPGGGTL